MADKTFSFKVSDETHDRAKNLIDVSGMTAKDWLENALALYEVKTLENTSPEFSQNLSELELHTTRIYELTVNMIKQATYMKDDAVRKIAESEERKTIRIEELEDERKLTNILLNESVEQNQILKNEIETYIDTIEENKTTVTNNQALIVEYKEKNDTLNGLLTKYQKYEEMNTELQEKLSTLQLELGEQAKLHELAILDANKKNETLIATSEKELKTVQLELKTIETNQKIAINNLEQQLQQQAEQHKRDMTFINQQHTNEIERTKLEVQAKYQAKLQLEIDTIRANYDERLKELLAPTKPNK